MLYMFIFYVPQAAAEAVKQAVFEAGAGRIGKYDCCCWETAGSGQFRPLAGSRPAIGRQGIIERVPELKVELVVDAGHLDHVEQALLKAHPYEMPAYAYWPVNAPS